MAMPAPMAIPTVTLFVIKFVLVTEGAVSIGGSSQEELLVHMALTCNVIPCITKYSILLPAISTRISSNCVLLVSIVPIICALYTNVSFWQSEN